MNNYKIEVLNEDTLGIKEAKVVNPVLIYNEEEAVLVDTDYPGRFEGLKKSIEKYIDINKLKTIIITHHDIDHVGSAREFKELLGDKVEILATEIEAKYISGKTTPIKLDNLEKVKNSLKKKQKSFYEMLKVGFPRSYVDVDKIINSGDVLNLAGAKIEVVGTPGHTPGHICLYIAKDKALITGDTLVNNAQKLDIVSDMYNNDPKEARESLKKLKELDIEKVYCYHGGLHIGRPCIDEIIAR